MQEAYYTIPPAFPSTGTYGQTQANLCSGGEVVAHSDIRLWLETDRESVLPLLELVC